MGTCSEDAISGAIVVHGYVILDVIGEVIRGVIWDVMFDVGMRHWAGDASRAGGILQITRSMG